MSVIKRKRNAPLAAWLLALPLALLTRCTTTTDGVEPDGGGNNGPEMPVVECTTVEQCGLPPSTCSGSMLVYYTNARCEDRMCEWDQNTMECGPAGGCYAGACAAATMTAAGSPPQPSCGDESQSNAPECTGGSGGNGSGGSGDNDDGGSACDPGDDGGPGQCAP